MNHSATYFDGQGRNTVDPFYVKGDVFQRDQRYYDQQIGRRNRSPIKGNPNDGINNSNNFNNTSGPGQMPSYIPNHSQSQISQPQQYNPPPISQDDIKILR